MWRSPVEAGVKKERHDVSRVFLFGFRGPKAASALWFKMLGGNEFRLRRGFAFGKTLVRAEGAGRIRAGRRPNNSMEVGKEP